MCGGWIYISLYTSIRGRLMLSLKFPFFFFCSLTSSSVLSDLFIVTSPLFSRWFKIVHMNQVYIFLECFVISVSSFLVSASPLFQSCHHTRNFYTFMYGRYQNVNYVILNLHSSRTSSSDQRVSSVNKFKLTWLHQAILYPCFKKQCGFKCLC